MAEEVYEAGDVQRKLEGDAHDVGVVLRDVGDAQRDVGVRLPLDAFLRHIHAFLHLSLSVLLSFSFSSFVFDFSNF